MSTRDTNGRFKKDNPGGPGRPSRSTEFDYLVLLGEGVPKELWMEIILEAVTRAKSGEAKSREWLSRYLLPRDKGNNLHDLAMREDAAAEETWPRRESQAQGDADSRPTE